MKAHMTSPCADCPYRMDAPRGLWHRSEFERLLDTDVGHDNGGNLGSTYSCHKQVDVAPERRGFCAGWALDQRKRGVPSIALRLLLLTDAEAAAAFKKLTAGGHKLFASVAAMCRANGVTRRRTRVRRAGRPTR